MVYADDVAGRLDDDRNRLKMDRSLEGKAVLVLLLVDVKPANTIHCEKKRVNGSKIVLALCVRREETKKGMLVDIRHVVYAFFIYQIPFG